MADISYFQNEDEELEDDPNDDELDYELSKVLGGAGGKCYEGGGYDGSGGRDGSAGGNGSSDGGNGSSVGMDGSGGQYVRGEYDNNYGSGENDNDYGGSGGQYDKREFDDNWRSGEDDNDYEGAGGQYDKREFAVGKALEDNGISRLEEQVASNFCNERQKIDKILQGIFQKAVKSKTVVNVPRVFEPLKNVIIDPEPVVKSTLVECLPNILVLYQESPHVFSENPTRRVLDIVSEYLHDSENQVRQDATGVIKTLLDRELLDVESIEQSLCKTIVELSCDSCQDFQTLALSLMTRVNPFIGDELTEKLFLDRFLDLCSSEAFFVRRVCASIMGEFCTILSKEAIYNKLLHTYSKLCLDPVWGVRKTTVDVMMSVARCVPLTMRRHLLSKLLVHHLRDDSRWVRRSAYEILGPFISTFAKQFHELICDQKGELVLVHENEHGWPRFNVVPVAKFTDILSENLNVNNKMRESSTEEKSWMRKNSDIVKWKRRTHRSRGFFSKIRSAKDCDNDCFEFNTFQYYYNPPDKHLDMDFVKSIIKNETDSNTTNNDKSTNTDENVNQTIIIDFNVQDTKNNTAEISIKQENQQQQADTNENVSSEKQIKHQQQQTDNNDNESNEHEVRLQIKNQNEENRDENSDDEDEELNNDDKVKEKKPRFRYIIKVLDNAKNALNETFNVSYSEQQSPSNNIRSSNDSSLEMYDSDSDQDDDNEIVPRILVKYFVSMAEFQSNSNDIGPDLDYHCAFSFPAVVLTLGKENWPRLKEAYQLLAGAVAWKVRSTLASSIHEIATIIGKEYTASDLVPIFNGFIKDLDEVRIGALKHFFTFLNVLSPQDRTQYLPKLNDFLITDSKWNWRLREELVQQLSLIIKLYQCTDVAQYIAPLLLHLMQDRVAAVRQEAVYAVANTVSYLKSHSDVTMAIAMLCEMRNLLKSHAHERWMIRQTYALVCENLIVNTILNGEVFARELLWYLFELSYDKVPNVRLVVARTFSRLVYQMSTYLDTELMNEVRQKLKDMQKDTDRDVRMFASDQWDKFF